MSSGPSKIPRNDTKAIPPSRFYARLPMSTPLNRRLRTPETPEKVPLSLQPTTTPRSKKTSGSYKFSSEFHRRKSLNEELATETAGHYLGSMPPTEFLNMFLPVTPSNPPCPANESPFSNFRLKMREYDMYTPFINGAKQFVKSMKFQDTHNYKDPKCDYLSPDVALYHTDDKPDNDHITDFSRMEMFVELKPSPDHDPFCDSPRTRQHNSDNPHPFENNSDLGCHSRGQLASYLAALANCQFRTHIFCVFICGRFARFIRWDPSGAVVSARFDYTIGNTLSEFFWRYSHLPRPSRGYDVSVVPATLEETKQIGYDLQAELKNNNEYHRTFFKMMIPERNDPSVEHPHIISYPPSYQRQSTFGRTTRAMVAVDAETQTLVFVKAYWRAKVDDMEKEGEIYATLESHQVPHIAPFGHGNDVRDISTLTQTFCGASWASSSKELVLFACYRMSLKVIGTPLYNFSCSKEFVQGIADAMTAHDAAFFVAGILHRDISVGNVILTAKGGGLLIDWDLCIRVANMKNLARRPDRTGTWQFMSAAILRDPKKPHDAEDDRESAYHLLNWLALRYTQHDKIDELQRHLVQFDECFKLNGPVEGGGDTKKSRMIAPLPITFRSSNLNPLLEELRKALVVRYQEPPSQAEYKELEQLENSITASEKVIQDVDIQLQETNIRIEQANVRIEHAKARIEQANIQLQETVNQLQETTTGVSPEVFNLKLALRDSHITIRDSQITIRDTQIANRDSQRANRDSQRANRDSQISNRDSQITRRNSHYAFLYMKKMQLLSEKGWLVGILRRHLESDGWPENDAAKANLIGTGPPKKRNWEQSQIIARLPVSKHRRLSIDNFEWDSDDPDAMDPLVNC